MKKKHILITFLVFTTVITVGCIHPRELTHLNESIDTREFEDPDYTPQPTSVNATELELQTHTLINQERIQRNLSELEWNGEIAAVARNHSKYLANLEKNEGFVEEIYISHEGAEGEKHGYRLEKAEIYYSKISAENVAAVSAVSTYYEENKTPASYLNTTEIVKTAVEGWMNSEGHRKNILTSEFEETGIGIFLDSTKTNYIFTQVFITRAECGYRYGECCEHNACFKPLKCVEGVCIKPE